MREINATLFFIKKFNLIILFAYIYEIFALWKFQDKSAPKSKGRDDRHVSYYEVHMRNTNA